MPESPPSFSIFADLPEDDRIWSYPRLRRRVLREGEIAFCKGDSDATIFLIASGRIKICVTTPDGRETMIAMLSAGDCFGELEVRPKSPD